MFEFAPRPDLHLTSAAARVDLEVGELNLEGDGAAANAGALAVAPHLVDALSQGIPRGFVGEQIGGKGVLRADGFADPMNAGKEFCCAQPSNNKSPLSRNAAAGNPNSGP